MDISFSVIVPTYNWEKYLSTCIDSILLQTVQDFEIIIVDGWSTDRTLDIINHYLKKDKRIRLIHQMGKGLWNARNLWVEAAKWKYLTFIDCDDFIESDYIESFIEKIYEWYDMIIWWFVKYISENDKKEVFIKDNWIWKYLDTWPWWRFIKRSFLQKNNIKFLDKMLREDAHFNITIFNCTKKIAIIHDAKYYYRISNDDSMCKTLCRKFDPNYIEWLNKMWEIKPIDNENKEMKDYAIIRACIFYLLYSWMYWSSREFVLEYKKLFEWIKDNIPQYWKNKYLSFFTRSENIILYKFGISWFILLDNLHLVPLFARIWCRWK